MKIHKEGYPSIIIAGLFVALVIFTVCYFYPEQSLVNYILSSVGLVFFFFIVRFFRVPKRNIKPDDNAIISAADGVVVAIEEVEDKEYFNDKRIQVSVFMSPLNQVGCIIDKEAILSLGGYNENFKISQDYELWSHIMRNDRKLTSIPDILVAIRLHEQSVGSLAANDRGLMEKSQTMLENIRSMSNLVVTLDNAINIQKSFGRLSGLSRNDFYETMNMFVEIYNNLKFEVDPELLKKYIKTQIAKAYSMYALDEMSSESSLQPRGICKHFLTEYGFQVMPFAIYFFSYGGNKAISLLFALYKKYNTFKAMRLLFAHRQSIPIVIKGGTDS